MRHEVAGKDRERVRTAHGNYSQRESEQAQRVWQVVKIQEAENQIVLTLRCMPSGLQIRLCCCPRSRCTNRDRNESRAWWPPMWGFIRERARTRDKSRACGECRCPIRKPQVANGNVFSTSVGFVEGKSGGPRRRVESASSNEDMGCVVASIPVWTACDDGWGSA
jgi:hypothetical protein